MSLFKKTFAKSEEPNSLLMNYKDPVRHHPFQVVIGALMINKFPEDCATETYHVLNSVQQDVFIHLLSHDQNKIINLAAFQNGIFNMKFNKDADKLKIQIRKYMKNMQVDKKIIFTIQGIADLEHKFDGFHLADLSKNDWIQELSTYVKQ